MSKPNRYSFPNSYRPPTSGPLSNPRMARIMSDTPPTMRASLGVIMGETKENPHYSLHNFVQDIHDLPRLYPISQQLDQVRNAPFVTRVNAAKMSIPTSTSVTVSTVIEAPLARVWHLVKLQDFSKWWSALKQSDLVKGVSDEADIARWQFKDGTQLDVKQEEHSAIQHFITYSIVSSSEKLEYSSQLSKITCQAITAGKFKDCTVVTWTADFSGDAGAEVIQDARYKREEALADLAKAVA